MAQKCVICGSDIPKDREKKDTCSPNCAMQKLQAWTEFLHDKKQELVARAIAYYKEKGYGK